MGVNNSTGVMEHGNQGWPKNIMGERHVGTAHKGMQGSTYSVF